MVSLCFLMSFEWNFLNLNLGGEDGKVDEFLILMKLDFINYIYLVF